MPANSQPFEVFYDDDCPLCRREINFIRKRDRDGSLVLIDISNPGFEPETTGKSLDELMREIHGRHADGTIVIGVEVFREIYTRIGWGKLVAPTRLPGITWLTDSFYSQFAKLRYRAAMKRMQSQSCPLSTPEPLTRD